MSAQGMVADHTWYILSLTLIFLSLSIPLLSLHSHSPLTLHFHERYKALLPTIMDTISAAGIPPSSSTEGAGSDSVRLMLQHVAFPLLVGLGCHFTVEPGARRWHRTLRKSGWTPPPVAFPIVWLLCYVNLGFASYRTMKSGGGSIPQVAGYVCHVLAVNAWNPLFFRLRKLKYAAYLLAGIIATTPLLLIEIAFWDTIAAAMLFPYYLWLLLLCHLSFYMAHHNPGPHFGFLKDEIMDLADLRKNDTSTLVNDSEREGRNGDANCKSRRDPKLFGIIAGDCGIKATQMGHVCKGDKGD